MRAIVRIIGVVLVIIGAVNLYGLLYALDPELLKSPSTVAFRYSLMFLAGIGFVLLLKWGLIIYFLGVYIAWVSYFLVYDGEGSLVPLWSTVPFPAVIALLSYFAWSKMSWSIGPKANHEHGVDA